MTQILAEYIKGSENFVPGDVRGLSLSEFRKLEKEGIVRKIDDLPGIEPVIRNDFTGKNILGQKYRRGIVDVVIPSKTGNVRSIKELRKAEKSGKITLTIVQRIFSPATGGFASTCNEGAQLNKGLGEFVLFLNDDVEIGPDFFSELIKPFEDSAVGMVGAKNNVMPWGINGSIMCVRRELLEMIGGFDERYFFMFEDNDLCDNVRIRGYEIAISEAEAKHEGGESINTASEFWRRNYYEGQDKYLRKWSGSRLIGAMIVGNESGRYLSRVIIDLFWRDLIDEMVVTCDQSNIETVEELQALKKFYPITIHYHDFKLFGKSENILRERAIQYAISHNAYGIITLDADEFFDEEVRRETLLDLLHRGIAWDFVLAHYWGDEDTVRTDGIFAHQSNVRLFRVCLDQSQAFYDKNLHCGSVPIYAYQQRQITDFILKHFGYIRKADIQAKKKRQEAFDPNKNLESPDLYDRMLSEGETMKWNKKEFLTLWKK